MALEVNLMFLNFFVFGYCVLIFLCVFSFPSSANALDNDEDAGKARILLAYFHKFSITPDCSLTFQRVNLATGRI